MKSRTTPRFRRAFRKLPERIQRQARETYDLFQQNPNHPSLRFKRIHTTQPIHSVRISRAHRALGLLEDDAIVSFWIGSHDEYEDLIRRV